MPVGKRQIDYDTIATNYVETRTAVAWVVSALKQICSGLPVGSVIVELGCGTGNHICALAEALPQHQYAGFDQSSEMLKHARAVTTTVIFSQGDAQRHWPYSGRYANLAFGVDVIHHIENLRVFFAEAGRVLKPGGILLIVTDSEQDLHNRSLTNFFPEILTYELARYPKAEDLHDAASGSGLTYQGAETVQGMRVIDTDYMNKLRAKCSSALRLISDEAHQRGLERVRHAQEHGELWRSLYTIYRYANA